jgi:FMN phosphatase YigB (HAD superfamily)
MKMKKAGIDSSIFSKILFSAARNKKIHYQGLLDEFGVSPSEVVVCGDRIATDLVPAKELGCRTVHMRWGRGIPSFALSPSKGDVDFSIGKLGELKEILRTL